MNASPAARALPIDVVIPCHEKDAWILPRAVAGARRNVSPSIGTVFVVAPESRAIRTACAELSCEFVLEDAVAPLPRRDVSCNLHGQDRSGWIYQQLIKLSADRASKADDILVLDADTVLTRPHIFRKGERTVLFVSTEHHDQYYDTYTRLLGEPWVHSSSFVTHYMLLERQKLEALRQAIEATGTEPWYRAILRLADGAGHPSFFSEYETYGAFCLSKFASEFLIEPADNLAFPPSWSTLFPLIAFASRKHSVSFHHYYASEHPARTVGRFLRYVARSEA